MPSLKTTIQKGSHYSKDDVCFLLSSTAVLDEMLQEIEITSPRFVYCSALSIGQKEFSATMQSGLKAQMTIVIDHDEYDGEKEIEYNRVTYSIYRTFVRNDGDIELYCEVRVGGN